MTSKQDAIADIVDTIKRHDISLQDITAALQPTPEQTSRKSGSILTSVFGFIGGILVFAGLAIFVGTVWNDIGTGGRIVVTLGTGFSAFIMALVCTTDEKFAKAATPLFLTAAILQPGGILVVMDEFSRGGDPAHGLLFMSLVMLIQQGMAFWAKQRTVLALTSIIFGVSFFSVAFDLMDLQDNLIGIVIGLSLSCIAWALDHSRHKSIAAINYFFGTTIFLVSFFDIVEYGPFEILFLGVTCALIFISTMVRSRTLLFVGTVSTLGYIAYFSGEYFADSLGWPLTLMLMGFILIGFSAFAVKLNNKYIKQK